MPPQAEVAILDTPSMENSVSLNCALAYLAQVALRDLGGGRWSTGLQILHTKHFGSPARLSPDDPLLPWVPLRCTHPTCPESVCL